MSGDELTKIAEKIYGKRWREPLARILDVDLATLRRWTSGQIKVPGPVALAMKLMDQQADIHTFSP
jgi:hypothetical protein